MSSTFEDMNTIAKLAGLDPVLDDSGNRKGFDIYTSTVYLDFCADYKLDPLDQESKDFFGDEWYEGEGVGICVGCGCKAEHQINEICNAEWDGERMVNRFTYEQVGSICCGKDIVSARGHWI